MKKNVFTFFIFLIASPSQEQLPVAADSIYRFIKTNSIHRNTVNWAMVDKGFTEKLKSAITTKDTMKSLVYVFEQLNDVHSQMNLGNQFYGNYPSYDDSTLRYLMPLVNKSREQNGIIKTLLLDKQYVYLLLPGINAQGDAVTGYAQAISDSICKYNQKNIKGFIIDLRLNSGGQLSSMLGGLNLLLGNNYVGGGVDITGAETRKFELKGNNFYIGDYKMTAVSNKCSADYSLTPVAVIIGPATLSSGSITAIAFKGRPNTFFLGEPTAGGYTTANDYFQFGNSLTLNMATGFIRDRKQVIYKNAVPPDEIIKGNDDFDNLLNDKKIKAALLWLQKK